MKTEGIARQERQKATARHSKQKTSPAFGWYVTIVVSILSAIIAAATGQFSATLGPLSAQIGTTERAVAIADAIKSVFVIVGMMITPGLIKRYGCRAVYIASFVAFMIPQLVTPYISSYPVLIAMKITQGFAVLLFPLMLVIVAAWSRPSDIGFAMSILTGLTYAGGALGGTIAGYSATHWGWQSSYHVLSALMTAFSALLFLTVPMPGREPQAAASKESGEAYRRVVRDRTTWLLVLIFIPTVWTVQAIWADMVPFGQSLAFTNAQVGNVMAISALAIVIASLISGKASDIFAARSANRFRARVGVFSAGMLLIVLGVAVITLLDIAPPDATRFNFVAFFLSFGAAWGIGSFYCIFPEYFEGDEVSAANGFIGGLADVGMPASPMFMAVVGIGMKRWDLAWLSCAAVCIVGLFFAQRIRQMN